MTILNRRFENPIYLSSNAYYHHTHFGINERRQPRRNGNMYRTTVFNTFWKLLYNHFSCIILQQPPISKNMNFPSTCLSNTTSIAKIKSHWVPFTVLTQCQLKQHIPISNSLIIYNHCQLIPNDFDQSSNIILRLVMLSDIMNIRVTCKTL